MSKKVKEKRTDFLGFLRDFMGEGKVEKSQEEEIQDCKEVTEEVKKELIEALAKQNKEAKRNFREQYKAIRVNNKAVDEKQTKEAVRKYLEEKESKGREPSED